MIIYRAISLKNGKVYIGQTRVSLMERKGSHRRNSFRYGSKAHFHCAINKYGMDGFVWDIIDTADTIDRLNMKEIFWIKHYNATDRTAGYNLTSGGGSPIFTDDLRKKMGDIARGRKHTQEQNSAKAKLMSGSGNNFYGKFHSEETKERISTSRKGKGLGQTKIQKTRCPRHGSDNGLAKITEKDAARIKQLTVDGLTPKQVEKETGISPYIIKAIRQNKTWRHVAWPLDLTNKQQ